MNQQFPSQPGQQPSTPIGLYAPPPKKMSTGAKVGIGCGGAFGALLLIGVIGVAVGGGDSGTQAGKPGTAVAAPAEEQAKGKAKETAEPAGAKPEKKSGAKPKAEPKKKPKAAPQSSADRFKAFVGQHGSANEKAAIGHVTKVQGAEEQNDILDSVDVYTDFTGGMFGPHQSEGKLIASAFADWKDSENGLVTVYDAKGEMLSNGNF
ncbi:hypothetical protein ACWC9R_36255 [Streptomyces sp. NPDC001219]